MRVRAFHIMDPKGIPEMLLVFLEERGGRDLTPPTFDKSKVLCINVETSPSSHSFNCHNFTCSFGA